MAFFSERETVLRLFRDGADAYYQQSKYEVGELIQAQSPPKEGKLPYSRSLEHYTSLLTNDSSKQDGATKQSVNKQQTNEATKCKTISFDDSKPNNFKFEKCEVPTEVKGESALSSSIVRVKFIDFKVFFPKKSEPFFVQVRQPESATVEVVMKQAIAQYNEQSKAPLPTDITCYKFYMAEDDGSPEEFGVLGSSQIAAKMGKEFAVVPTKDTRAPSVDRRPLVIRLPQKEKATIPFQVNMKISDVIRKVCDRRNMNPADYHLEIGSGPLASDVCVQDISPEEAEELELCPNVVEGAGVDVPEVTTFHDTFKWKTFDVVYNKRKNYSLGVDGEHIQIFKKKTGAFSKEKKELHQFADLDTVAVGKGSKGFTITWKDGKQDLFESSGRKEIIAKIEAIQQRKRDSFF